MPMPWKKLDSLLTWLLCGLVAGWLLGRWVRDATFLGKFLFYIPTPIVFWSCAIRLVFMLRRSRPRGIFLMAGMALAVMKLIDAYALEEPGVLAAPRTLVQWNTMNMQFGSDKLEAELLRHQPAIIVLNEPGSAEVADRLAGKLGPFADTFVINSLALVSEFPILEREPRSFTHASALRVKIQLPEGPLTVVACNLSSNPLYNRGKPLGEIGDWLASLKGPVVVTGDFNTPLDSVYFDSWRENWSNAWETHGRGWAWTWPQPIPCYAIDHSWYNRAVSGGSLRLQRQALSDHKLQVFQFGLE